MGDHRLSFYDKFHAFQRKRGESTEPPSFAKKAVDQFKLWTVVQEAGGHAEVTGSKGWARVGRLFDPPKTMTDLSFRIKKIYENNLLPFEKAVLDGSIEGVHMPPRVAQSAPSGPSMKPSRPGRASKRGSSGLPGNAPKRTRQNADGSTDEMVGKRIRVLWPEERQFFSGTVTDFEADKGLHRIDYDDGDEELLDLSTQTWHLLTDISDGGEPSAIQLYDNGGLGQLHSAAEVLANADAQGAEDDQHLEQEQDGALDRPNAERVNGAAGTNGKPGKSDDGCILQGEGYKVFELDDPPGFEVFCLIPGLQIEEIRVQCWDSGKLLVTREPKDISASAPWGVGPLKHKIRLPKPVHAKSARALGTLHGQLYIKIFCEEPAAPAAEQVQEQPEEQLQEQPGGAAEERPGGAATQASDLADEEQPSKAAEEGQPVKEAPAHREAEHEIGTLILTEPPETSGVPAAAAVPIPSDTHAEPC